MDLAFPLAGTFLYLSYPWNGSSFIILHNLALHIYSVWTCYQLSMVFIINKIHFKSGYYMNDPWVNQVIFYFYLSKYYEYLDTFILYAKGKNPIFLQKYHHVGAVICWHLAWIYKVDAIVLASLANSFIHSIMYLYYLLTFLKYNLNRIKPYITYLQILQFFSGFTSIYLYYPIESHRNKLIIVIFLIYNLGLLFLFTQFAINTYHRKSERLLQ